VAIVVTEAAGPDGSGEGPGTPDDDGDVATLMAARFAAVAAATASAAVGVIGLPHAPQKRAPSSISAAQCGQVAIVVAGLGGVDSDVVGARVVAVAFHDENAARCRRHQGQKEERHQ